MEIKLEQIDELRKRTNCSYQEAKTLLEKNNGNVLDAIVDFEKQHSYSYSDYKDYKRDYKEYKRRCREEYRFDHERFKGRARSLFHRGNRTRLIVMDKDKVILNLSIIFVIIITCLAFHVTAIGIIIALILGYSFKLRRDGEDIDIDSIMTDNQEKQTQDFTDKESKSNQDKKDSDYNETTVE